MVKWGEVGEGGRGRVDCSNGRRVEGGKEWSPRAGVQALELISEICLSQ